jgi:hypothetical protein
MHSTTFSPSKNHIKTTTFSKTPSKNPAKHQNSTPKPRHKKIRKKSATKPHQIAD